MTNDLSYTLSGNPASSHHHHQEQQQHHHQQEKESLLHRRRRRIPLDSVSTNNSSTVLHISNISNGNNNNKNHKNNNNDPELDLRPEGVPHHLPHHTTRRSFGGSVSHAVDHTIAMRSKSQDMSPGKRTKESFWSELCVVNFGQVFFRGRESNFEIKRIHLPFILMNVKWNWKTCCHAKKCQY